jgi:serine/threonine protein kinase
MADSIPIDVLNGRYELLELLGAGGMGEVYRGRDRMLGRSVAVKRCKRDSPEWRAMFTSEAKSQSRLFHSHIVAIFDFGFDFDGLPYIIMEYFEGRSVQDMIARVGKLDVPRAIEIIRTAGEALSVAHSRKIVHRDVKPANMLIGADGLVKLSDFGLATRRGAGAVPGFGTPWFAAPEQGSGDEDHRVDIYALAMTLTCLVAGQPLSRDQVATADFPESIRQTVFNGLSPNPADRPGDMDAFLNMLPPAFHNRVGTPAAVTFCNQRGLRPARKHEHRDFVFDLGDSRFSAMKKLRTIIGYGIHYSKNTAYYIIRLDESNGIDMKHAYKANTEYGALLGFSRTQMEQLIDLPQRA